MLLTERNVDVLAQQTHDHELVTNKEPISNQKGIEKEPIGYQNVIHKVPIRDPLVTNKVSDYESISNQISNQICENEKEITEEVWGVEKATYELRRLNGLQRKIVFYVGTKCISNDQLTSGPIAVQELKALLDTDLDTIKTAVQRVVSKGFIYREEGKRGTGGFSSFRISSSLRQAILNDMHQSQISNQLGANYESNKEPKGPLSSSNKITTTTKEEGVDKNFPADWQTINITPLESIGFSKLHLLQVFKFGHFSPEIVQDSINAFAFDLEVNNKENKLKGPPLNFFMGILKNGMPYIAPQNYEDPKIRAMKDYVEQKTRQQAQKEHLKAEAYKTALDEWMESLSEDQIAEIIPESKYREKDRPYRNGFLEKNFKEKIWPNILKEMNL